MDENKEDLTFEYLPATIIDVIDLTKESPKIRPSQSHRRHIEDIPVNHYTAASIRYTRKRRPLSPLVLANNEYERVSPTWISCIMKTTRHDDKSTDEIVNLDETIDEDNKHYTVESTNSEPTALTCPICLESLSSKLKPTTTRCGHIYCAECLKTYLRTSKKCPTCKTAITLKSCTRLYI